MRTPQLDQLAGVLHQQQLVTRIEDVENEGKVLFVEGDLTTDQVGEAAAAHGIVLHELTLQRGSLEQAFMQMTGDSVEYHAHDMPAGLHTMTPGGPPAPGLAPPPPGAATAGYPPAPREGM